MIGKDGLRDQVPKAILTIVNILNFAAGTRSSCLSFHGKGKDATEPRSAHGLDG